MKLVLIQSLDNQATWFVVNETVDGWMWKAKTVAIGWPSYDWKPRKIRRLVTVEATREAYGCFVHPISTHAPEAAGNSAEPSLNHTGRVGGVSR